MKDLTDVLYDILTDFKSDDIPKTEAIDKIKTEITRDLDEIDKHTNEVIHYLTGLSKNLLDLNTKYEKEIRKLTRKLLKV